ncbi:hypothetical protein [Microcoleus sp.]
MVTSSLDPNRNLGAGGVPPEGKGDRPSVKLSRRPLQLLAAHLPG